MRRFLAAAVLGLLCTATAWADLGPPRGLKRVQLDAKIETETDYPDWMFYTVTGKFLVKEIGVELPAGRIMGELGFLTPKNRRTQSVECIDSGEVLTITYDKLLELYFQNPEFGYYFLRLTSERMLQNIGRLEGVIAENKTQLDALKSAAAAPSAMAAPPEPAKRNT